MNRPRPAWLDRNVVAMGATSLPSDASHEATTSVLPGFLAVLGLPPVALGVIEGASDALSSFAKLGSSFELNGWRTASAHSDSSKANPCRRATVKISIGGSSTQVPNLQRRRPRRESRA